MTDKRIRRVRAHPGPAAGPAVSARVTSFGEAVQRADTSRQVVIEDEFQTTLTGLYLTPPYNPNDLLQVVERSNMLQPCVEAMVTNVAQCGVEVGPVADDVPMSKKEVAILQSFIDNANAEESLKTVNAKVYREHESLGYGYMEIIRDISGNISIFRHCKASQMRLTPRHKDLVEVTYDIQRGPRVSMVRERRRFRRFVQLVNGKATYFKEFGDPRKLNFETGKFDTEEPVSPDMEATEILHFRQDSEDPYGVPRWISQLPSVLGSREAEEVNLRYFEDNTVPPMLMAVSGGRLTGQSFRSIQNLVQTGVGKDRQHKIMLIEAVPETSGVDEKGVPVNIDIHKLTDARQSDGLFKDYDESNRAKTRTSFRLPPVAVGASQDVTFATANVSAFIAETQVYAPARDAYIEVLNKRVINNKQGLNLKTVKLKAKVPSITNPEMMMKTLTALNVMGAVTPRSAIDAANRMLQTALPQYPEKGQEGYEDWMDKPIVFVTRGTASDAGQQQKDASTKKIEDNGDVTQHAPENGQQ